MSTYVAAPILDVASARSGRPGEPLPDRLEQVARVPCYLCDTHNIPAILSTTLRRN